MPAASHDTRPPVGGFFRYHGAWAPGVRLFRRLGFRAKAAVISAVFSVPLVVLGWNYFGDKATAIEFSAKEHRGVAYADALRPVLQALQAQRAVALGEPGAVADLGSALKGLARAEAEHGAELGTAESLDRLRQAVEATAPSGAQAAVMAAFDGRIGGALQLLAHATDQSNLTLDPDIDTYYLMDAAMFRLPPIAEQVSQIAAIGRSALAGTALDAAGRRRAMERAVELRANADALRAGLKKASDYNPEVARAVDGAPLLAALDQMLNALETQVLGGAGGDGADWQQSGTAAVQAAYALQVASARELDRLVAVRVDGLASARNTVAVLLLVSLAVVAYLFTSFRKVLDGGLNEVARHIDAMRDGDLTTQPNPWGADEVARLMMTLREMQASLRGIVGSVRSASDTIVQASQEISSGSADLSQRTERAAANLQESAASMEEVAATVRQTADSATQAAEIARGNAASAARGGEVVGAMVQTMQEIQESSRRIGQIVGTIDGIAFQTNILALNAAVEAARAGDAGRGFAVVASEVRLLAGRAAEAAREIKSLITDSVERVEGGTRIVHDVGQTIQDIVERAGRVDTLLAGIAAGSREQAAGVAQTTQSVQDLDHTTQQNAALVEQTAAAALAMRQSATQLAGNVARFRLA